MKFRIMNVKEINDSNIEELNKSQYLLLQDKSSTLSFENMTKTTNLFLERGWKIVGLSSFAKGERLGLDYILHILLEH